jgi:AraC-like DNA-binding protein
LGGVEMRMREIITLGRGQRVHARSRGSCQWGALQLFGRGVCPIWRRPERNRVQRPAHCTVAPPRAALRQLGHLYQAAIRTAETRSGVLADKETVHGLEQQMIHALVESLSAGPVYEETETARQHRGVLARFEDLLEAEPPPSVTEIYTALGVSHRLLRECCRKTLGTDPSRYRRLHGMQRAHSARRRGTPDVAGVSALACRYGFRNPSRFCCELSCPFRRIPCSYLAAA